MQFQRILVTGGAGFVGANLAVLLKQSFADRQVIALDNLQRRGSELNLPRLRAHGVAFRHGDIRVADDLGSLPEFDLMIDCAAEPAVQAGTIGGPQPVINTNLLGTVQCLEAARRHNAAFLLLSTSRVYPLAALNALRYHETATRFEWEPDQPVSGFSERGVSEQFSLEGPRSFYGAAKLASELLLQEYVHSYRLPALINRCGVIAGPWQMGRVDQGVIALWVARHVFQQPLSYIGFGGTGKQVRDVLHIEDLLELVVAQLQSPSHWNGGVYNVGGGREVSVSLAELTVCCQAVTGRRLEMASVPQAGAVDLRIYLTDASKAQREFGWRPRRSVETIVRDTYAWIAAERDRVASVFLPGETP